MKKAAISILVNFVIFNFTLSQTNIFPGSGNVGIGTVSPNASLEVAKTPATYVKPLILSDGNGKLNLFLEYPYDGLNYLSMYLRDENNTNKVKVSPQGISYFNGGNIGIGTNNPLAKLSVDGFIKAQGSDGRLMLENPSVTTSIYFRNRGIENQRKLEILYGTDVKCVMDNLGNFGIGTDLTSNPNNYKLAVNGTIGAKEVKVEITSSAWSDFVFEDNYHLTPIKEVEKFIDENNHLPDIPTAEEVAENGVNLAEMDSKLLQKIEELTLYIIEQNKEIEKLKETLKKNGIE